MSYFGFDQLNTQYLEPPDDSHYPECENKRWYWCDDCQTPFVGNSTDGTPVNMHTDYQYNTFRPMKCNAPFGKSYDECVCQWIKD